MKGCKSQRVLCCKVDSAGADAILDEGDAPTLGHSNQALLLMDADVCIFHNLTACVGSVAEGLRP